MSTETFEVVGLPLPVAVRRVASARRLRLRVDHGGGLIRLTMPARGSARAALRWAGEQRAWVEQQIAAAPQRIALVDGTRIPFCGEELEIRWTAGARRGVQRQSRLLLVGGPSESTERSVERWLRDQARAILSAETERVAQSAGVQVRSVSVGDPVSRWGSCSSAGAIRYSWRLVLAPPDALRFVVAHEVAHRLHMNHSAEFKAAEQRLFGGPVARARSLLRELGPSLRRVGRA